MRRDGTKPELELRRELHSRGLRYRVNIRPIPPMRGSADIVFTRAKVAVYVDGCFWHGCPVHWTQPASNAAWWLDKVSANQERDARGTAVLVDAGWRVLRVWEHENPVEVADRIEEMVRH